MLTIGKLAHGQELYYEDSAASSLQAYYAGEGEAPGVWVGALCKGLGLEGFVKEGELSQMFAGDRPGSGERLRGGPEVRVAGFDFTWAAPKSLSLISVLAPEEIRRQVIGWHEESVRVGMAYLEETAIRVRRGKGGHILQAPGGLLAAAYRHRAARALLSDPNVQDPHLHTHVVAANMAPGEDGRWTALDHPLFFRAAQTAGYLYQAHLRALVREGLGLEWGEVHKGMAELADFDSEVLRAFSRRTQEVESKGLRSGAKSKRVEKAAHRDWEQWRLEVEARAAEHGLDRQCITDVLARGRERLLAKRGVTADRDLTPLFEQMSGELGLTEKRNTFTERDVLRALAQNASQGAPIDILRQDAREYGRRGEVLRTKDQRMTVTNLTLVERRLVDAAVARKGKGVAQLPVAATQHTSRVLNHDQRLALEAVIASGHGVQVIEALAGSGKSYLAGAIREVYEANGYPVVGVAPTGRARRELSQQTGAPARTLAGQVLQFAAGRGLPDRCVVLLDEASMAGTRLTARLMDEVARADGKLVAIGDSGQLHSVDAGGFMTAIGRRVGVLKLSEVLRQESERERQVLALMHDRKPKPWMEWAQANGRITFGDTGEQIDRTIEQWTPLMERDGLLGVTMIARSNDTRDVLNQRAREIVKDRGMLGAELVFDSFEVAVGDRLICRLNDDWNLGVDNGTRGVARAVDAEGVILLTDAGEERRLPAGYVARHVEHAYALTGHAIQGANVTSAVVCALPHELTQGWAYTALSRARRETHLNVVSEGAVWKHHEEQRREDFAPREIFDQPTEEELVKRVLAYMRTPDSEELAIEQLPREQGEPGKKIPDRDTRPVSRRRDDPNAFMAYMNPRRRSTLQAEMLAVAERAKAMSEGELRAIVDGGEDLLRSLDKSAAAACNRLEREFLERRDQAVSCERRAEEIRRQVDGLGWRHRHQRSPLAAEAEKLERDAERSRSEMDRIELQLSRFRAQGRHPDQWLERHYQEAALVLAGMTELHAREFAQEVGLDRERDLGEERGP